MMRPASSKRDWIVPELVRLGKFSDVAGKETPLTQATNTKS
jgi:hypothetical protein